MSRRATSIWIAGSLIGGLVVIIGPSCSTDSRPNPERYLTDPRDARRAVEESLEAWHKSPDLERTTPTIRPVMFVDQTRKPGQRLRQFTVLGEVAGGDGCRQIQVKLALEQPDESMLASYYVFGQGPIWVYRAEDFEMMMHMDPMSTQASDAASEPNGRSKAEPEHANPVRQGKASETKTGSTPLP